ncbi:hypothetical protein, partial [Pseudomonas sp. TH10]|uniref:hypothetical protein n=1 Tax=Pseudomonas sp. TH10 TaxID=2796376 RepID=UPI001A9330DD
PEQSQCDNITLVRLSANDRSDAAIQVNWQRPSPLHADPALSSTANIKQAVIVTAFLCQSFHLPA